jgi:hypothetical protein
MANITTRGGKGSPLSFQEVDNNFTGLNQDIAQLELTKYDASDRANEQQARTGQDNSTLMTPLRVAQAIDEQASKLSIGLVIALS